MATPQIVAIIPARAGSKGISGKNLRHVAGKSLLAWSISAAKQSRYNLRVVVSTDGEAIAEEARRHGAEAVMRPEAISGDTASSEAALLHVLDELEAREGYTPDLVVFLQCTSPLTQSEDIDGTIDALWADEADSALAVIPFHYFLWRPQANGDWDGINHTKTVRLMRQQREPEYLESGAVYVMKTAPFREKKHRFFGKTTAHVMPAERRWEIDEPEDLEIANILMRSQKENSLPFKPSAVIFDFDGVLTDNAVWVDDTGHESVRCDRGDGMGIEMLRKTGLPMLILSKEVNAVVSARAAKLKLEVLQSIEDKPTALKEWANRAGLPLEELFYVGNDLNDLGCMRLVGCAVAVADAHPSVLQEADVVLSRPGGHGAVRELAERILELDKN